MEDVQVKILKDEIKKMEGKINKLEEKMTNDKYTFTETLKSELIIAATMFIPLTFTITGLF